MLALLAALSVAAAPAVPPAGASDGPAQIRAVVARMQDAWNRGDLRGYMQGFWNPGVRFVSGGRILSGWQPTLDHYLRDYDTPEKRGRLCFYDVEVQMLSPDAAQLVSRYHLERRERPQDGVNTRLFRKVGGRWVVALNHVSNRQETGATGDDSWRARCPG
jgi:uncharacterized protein (TIGR02246 family)